MRDSHQTEQLDQPALDFEIMKQSAVKRMPMGCRVWVPGFAVQTANAGFEDRPRKESQQLRKLVEKMCKHPRRPAPSLTLRSGLQAYKQNLPWIYNLLHIPEYAGSIFTGPSKAGPKTSHPEAPILLRPASP